jgi:hypothetical protein
MASGISVPWSMDNVLRQVIPDHILFFVDALKPFHLFLRFPSGVLLSGFAVEMLCDYINPFNCPV